ncbi:RloB family protein [Acetobacter sp.]|uniref:RloB family protein n=1 Tax=Acetobacter sp. TaxID=440 RepID=UPI0039E996A8
MSLTSRKKRPLDRSVAVRDAQLFVIATEGEKTEDIYFSAFQSTKIRIKTIPTVNGASAPDHVFRRLLEFRDQYQLDDTDELWLVIDRDKWPVRSLRQIASDCQSKKIGLALSNPCFEIWLAMHYEKLEDFPEKLKSCEAFRMLKNCCKSYNKSNFDPKLFIDKTENAISVAKELDKRPRSRWPDKTGSRVYRLVEKINSIL